MYVFLYLRIVINDFLHINFLLVNYNRGKMEFDAFNIKKIYLCSYSILSPYYIKLITGSSSICSNLIKCRMCKLNRQTEETVIFKFFYLFYCYLLKNSIRREVMIRIKIILFSKKLFFLWVNCKNNFSHLYITLKNVILILIIFTKNNILDYFYRFQIERIIRKC